MTDDAAPVMGEPNDPVEPVEGEPVEEPTDEPPEDPAEGLKKALAAERKLRRDAEKRAAAADQALADKDKPAEEAAIEQVRREGREQAQSSFNARLIQAELKAALAGKVSDTSLALKVIDTSANDVSGDGEVDAQSVTDAIADALSAYPILAPGRKAPGSADQGTRGKDSAPAQLTRNDLSKMTPEQIVAAYDSGQVADLVKGS